MFFRISPCSLNKVVHILQEMDLLSDVGGQVGLWLGFSVITAIEFIEFVGDAIMLILTYRKRKRVDPDKESKQALKKAKLAFT